MKQIFNWTIGSFFRSIGRIAAYLIIGGIITYLVTSGGYLRNIKLTDLLGIEKVNASSYGTIWPNNVKFTDSGTQNYASVNLNYDFYSIARTVNGWANNGFFKFDQVQLNTNAKDLFVNFRITKITADNIDMDYSTFSCTIDHDLDQFNSSIYGNAQGSYDYNLYDFTGVDCEFEDLNGQIRQSNYVISLKYWYNNNEDIASSCYLVAQASGTLTFRCPIVSSNINGFRYSFYSRDNSNYYFGFSPFLTYELSEAQAIINAQNNTTNSINSMNQTISDTNTTSDISSASHFFGDYNETATDGVAAIVSMPLNIFNALTTGSTKDLCFTLKGKQSCFPSGSILWNKSSRSSVHVGNSTWTPHPFSDGGSLSTGLSAFKILFNVVVSGFLGYKMLKSIMRIVNDMLNPTKDKVEVLEL